MLVTHLAARHCIFLLFYVVCSVRVHDSGRILEDYADKSLMCCLFFLFSISEVSSEDAECLVCFVGDGVYVKSPIKVVLYVYA